MIKRLIFYYNIFSFMICNLLLHLLKFLLLLRLLGLHELTD